MLTCHGASRILLVLLLLFLSTTFAYGAEPVGVQPFAPAVVIDGSPKECGQIYGKTFRDSIQTFLEREIYQAFVGKPSSKQDLLAYAAACGQVLQTECPTIAEEFEGIAEGAELTYDEIVLINLHEELYHRVPLAEKHGHCTAVAVGPPHTGTAQTLVGQTWDWMESVAGKSAIVQWRRKGGVPVLAYGFPGMPTGAGLNAEGIALCWTSAALGEKGQSPPRVGIPSYALIAHLLAQQDMASVIREARKNKHAGWFTFVLGDGEGNLVNIEGSPEGIVVEEHQGRLARVLFGSQEMTGTKPDQKVTLHPRCQKMYDLLDQTKAKNDLRRLQDYFADPQHGINVGKGTIDMMVFDTTARTAYLSRGSSYGVEWREYGFGTGR